MIDWTRTLLSEYANSPTILQMMQNINNWIDPTADFQAFYDLVWNLDTAQGYGLDVWGRIVNVKRIITVVNTPVFFGFHTGVAPEAYKPFNQGPFYQPGEQSTSNYVLTDDAYRRLIYIKALSNISSCTIPVLNTLLQLLFAGRGRCYVSDLGSMRIRYTFEFVLQTYELSLLVQSRAMIRPTGVLSSILQIPRGKTFGFAEAGYNQYAPFNVGAFVNYLPVVGLVTPLGEVTIQWDNTQINDEGFHIDVSAYG